MRARSHSLHVCVAERLAQLPADAWDAVTAGAGLFLSRRFLAALEETAPEELQPRYLLLSEPSGQPAACAVLQLVRVRGARALAKQAPSVPGAVRTLAPWVDERALVLGNLAAPDETALAVRQGADALEAWRAVTDVLDRVRRFEKVEGHVNVTALKDVGPVSAEASALLRRRGYQATAAGATMTLALDAGWRGLDDYLGAMTAHSRCAVKKTVTQVEKERFVLRPLDAAEAEARVGELDLLYRQVVARAEVRPLELPGAFFAALKRRLGDDCALLALERGGALGGFVAVLRSGPDAVTYYLGYDKALGAPLYHRLLVASVEQALAWRARRLSMGRTSEETKARLGAVAFPTQLWLRHRVPPLNWGLSAVLGALPPPPPGAAARVFKQAAG